MPTKRLTEEGVKKLNVKAGTQVDFFDSGLTGLVLRVSRGHNKAEGTKTWRALYYVKDAGKTKPKTHKLGRYPHLSLKAARDKARDFLADPQKALAKAAEGSFKQVAEAFLKRHVEANGLRSEAEIRRCLIRYVYPKWQDRSFDEIRRGDVAALLDEIEDKNGARQADYVLAVVRKLCHWYQARNEHYSTPIVFGMRRTKSADRERRRILSDDEIKAAWRLAPEIHPTYGAIVKLLLLTAQRRDKLATMRWDDIDKQSVWTIQSEDREKGNAERLRLPKLAVEIIDSLPRIDGNPFVFAGSLRGRRISADVEREPPSFNSFSQRKAELDEKMLVGMPEAAAKKLREDPWVHHDLRRTAKSLMSRAGIRPDISERVLGHAIVGIERVYDRHQYDDEKANALERLAALIQLIIEPRRDRNVVSIVERL